jgi:hypothetical protein
MLLAKLAVTRLEDVLLAMTTKKPRAKMAATPIFCFVFIWSFITMEMGRLMAAMH